MAQTKYNVELLKALGIAKDELVFLFAQTQNDKFFTEQAKIRLSYINSTIKMVEGISKRLTIQTGTLRNDKPVVNCINSDGEIVLVLNNTTDVRAMQLAGLEPGNDNDVFVFANHLLQNKYESYEKTDASFSDQK